MLDRGIGNYLRRRVLGDHGDHPAGVVLQVLAGEGWAGFGGSGLGACKTKIDDGEKYASMQM